MVLPSDTFYWLYECRVGEQIGYIHERAIKKPIGALDRCDFHSLGERCQLEFQGKPAAVKRFADVRTLIESAKVGLSQDKTLSPELIGNIVLMLEEPHAFYAWDWSLEKKDKSHAGAIIGELMPAVLLLQNDYSKFSQRLFEEEITEVYFPTSNAFPLVDMFVRLKSGKIEAISHKFSDGAGASLLKNILYPIFDRKKELPKGSMIEELSRLDYKARARNQNLIFGYWLQHIVGVDTPAGYGYQVYREIAENQISQKTQAFLDRSPRSENVKDFWPSGIPYMTCKILAERIAQCPATMEIINTELGINGFWQVRLDEEEWHKKALSKYSVTYSKNCQNVEISYGKFTRSDISAREGALTFRIR